MQTVHEIQVTYSPNNFGRITSAQDAVNFFKNVWNHQNITIQEEFKVMFLNQGNNILGVKTISMGGITSTVVDVRIIVALALKSFSTSIILAHNHPAGTLRPSNADLNLTEKIKKAAEYFDIRVLDHLILAPDFSYYSFLDENRL